MAAFLRPAGKLKPIFSNLSLRDRPPFLDLALEKGEIKWLRITENYNTTERQKSQRKKSGMVQTIECMLFLPFLFAGFVFFSFVPKIDIPLIFKHRHSNIQNSCKEISKDEN